MIALAEMRPSDVQRLRKEPPKGERKAELLEAIRELFVGYVPDGGANDDTVFETAKKLSSASVWDHIEPGELATCLHAVDQQKLAPFIEGLPHEFARELSYLMMTERREPFAKGLVANYVRMLLARAERERLALGNEGYFVFDDDVLSSTGDHWRLFDPEHDKSWHFDPRHGTLIVGGQVMFERPGRPEKKRKRSPAATRE